MSFGLNPIIRGDTCVPNLPRAAPNGEDLIGLRLNPSGGVAQLGERVVRNDEVGSSILLLSTTHKKASITAGFFHAVDASMV